MKVVKSDTFVLGGRVGNNAPVANPEAKTRNNTVANMPPINGVNRTVILPESSTKSLKDSP